MQSLSLSLGNSRRRETQKERLLVLTSAFLAFTHMLDASCSARKRNVDGELVADSLAASKPVEDERKEDEVQQEIKRHAPDRSMALLSGTLKIPCTFVLAHTLISATEIVSGQPRC
jgi:hypothetical protein